MPGEQVAQLPSENEQHMPSALAVPRSGAAHNGSGNLSAAAAAALNMPSIAVDADSNTSGSGNHSAAIAGASATSTAAATAAGGGGGGGDALSKKRAYKEKFQEGVALFNKKPKKGITLLQVRLASGLIAWWQQQSMLVANKTRH